MVVAGGDRGWMSRVNVVGGCCECMSRVVGLCWWSWFDEEVNWGGGGLGPRLLGLDVDIEL